MPEMPPLARTLLGTPVLERPTADRLTPSLSLTIEARLARAMRAARSNVALHRRLNPEIDSPAFSDAAWCALYEGHVRAFLIQEEEKADVLRLEHLSGCFGLPEPKSFDDRLDVVELNLCWAREHVRFAREVMRHVGSVDMDDDAWLLVLERYLVRHHIHAQHCAEQDQHHDTAD